MRSTRWRKLPETQAPSGQALLLVGGVTGRRGCQRGPRMLLRSISGIGRSSARSTRVGQLVIALEAAAQPAAPSRNAAAGVQLEGRFAAVERRGDVVPRHLQQRRALQCGVAAAAEGLFEPGRDLGAGEIAVGRRDDQRRAGNDAQDLRDALARLQDARSRRGEMGVVGDAIAGCGESRVALGSGQAAAHGLHLDDQIDEVLDRLVVLLEAHRMRSERARGPG